MKRMPPHRALTPMCALALLALAGCATNPVSGKRELSLISESQEIQMGQDADVAAQAAYGLYPDSALAREIDRVGQKLAAVSDRPNLTWHFRLLDSPVVNAFALPGGYIFITRGILATFNSEAQLAGVMGHEIGHVAARHSVRQATQSQLANLGLGLGMVLLPGVSKYGNLASQGLGLLFLKFSRDDENQADELGVKYATKAGYDPREIPATYVMIQRMAASSNSQVPTFLATHPDPGDRINRTTAEAAAAVKGISGPLAIRANEYKSQLRGLVYGNDPRQGYLAGSHFYHPGLRFQMDFPQGWTVDNGHTAVTASAPGGAAGMQLTTVKSSGTNDPGAYVAALQQSGKVVQVVGGGEQIGGHAAWVGSVSASDGQGGTTALDAAWIAAQGGGFYQFLGGPGGDAGVRSLFNASVRSFRDLTDANRINVAADRLDLRSASGSQSLAGIIQSFSRPAMDEATAAWLNGLESGATPQKSFVVKLAIKGP